MDIDYKEITANVGVTLALILKKLCEFKEFQMVVGQLNEFVQNVTSHPESVTTLKKLWSEVVAKVKTAAKSGITQIMENNSQCLSESDVSCIMEEVKKLKVKMAEDTVKQGAVASGLIVIVQIWRLRQVWNDVKDAKNFILESRRTIDLLRTDMGQLQENALELAELMTQYEAKSRTEQERRNLMTRLRLKTYETNRKRTKIQDKLSELKVMINGKKHQLVVYKSEQISNGIMNGVNAVANIIQCVQSWSMLGTGLTVVQVGVTAGFSGLTAGNAVMYCITEKTLKEIQQTLDQIAEMQQQLESVEKTIEDAEQFLLQHLDDH